MSLLRKILAFSLLLLFACKQDIDVFIPDTELSIIPSETTEALEQFVAQYEPVLSAVSHSADSSYVYNEATLQLELPARLFADNEGELVSGDIDLQIGNIPKKADLIKNNLPNVTEDGNFFQQFGAFYLQANQNNNSLEFAEGQEVQVLIPLSGNVAQPYIQLFHRKDNNGLHGKWKLMPQEVALTEYYNEETSSWQSAYTFTIDKAGWYACGVFISSEQGLSDLCIGLPAGYDDKNTLVYIILKNQISVLDVAWQSGYFCKEGLPSNLEADILVMAASADGTFRAVSQPIQTIAGFQIKTLQPEEYSLDQVLSLINMF